MDPEIRNDRGLALCRGRIGAVAAAWVVGLLAHGLPLVAHAQSEGARVGASFPPWTPGNLDLHHIVTGRGNATFAQLPDGTTLLIDAGDSGETPGADPRPDASRRPGAWIARYVRHMAGPDAVLDYAVLTHFHPDHMGRIGAADATSSFADYRLSGITEVAEAVPIARLMDRGFPEYDYLPPPKDEMFANYRRFVEAQMAGGRLKAVMRAEAGKDSQLTLRRAASSVKDFEIRVVAVNDRVWTGKGEETRVRFPLLSAIAVSEDRPTENMCSMALRIKYGLFDYFTGGDMPGYPVPGGPAWHDTESEVARAIGATEAHVVNHHGSIESENPFWLATLKSRVMIVPAWAATHPSPDVLKRMLSPRLYPGPRDIFITAFREATKAAIGGRAAQVASDHGHVVIRVEPGGRRYWVLIVDDQTETFRVTSIHGPYTAE